MPSFSKVISTQIPPLCMPDRMNTYRFLTPVPILIMFAILDGDMICPLPDLFPLRYTQFPSKNDCVYCVGQNNWVHGTHPLPYNTCSGSPLPAAHHLPLPPHLKY